MLMLREGLMVCVDELARTAMTMAVSAVQRAVAARAGRLTASVPAAVKRAGSRVVQSRASLVLHAVCSSLVC